jgi:TatD DNase family protein
MNIIDTHAHIDQFEDLSQVLQRAYQAGVSDIMAMSVDLDSMQKLVAIAGQYQQPKIHLGLGVHPGMIKSQTMQMALDFLRAHSSQACAVGETGLDYWYKWVRKDEAERQKQKDFFAMHLDCCKEFDLPIVIHSRGAWQDCLTMTQAAGVTRALFHWYSGPEDILDKIIDAGFYVSTSPSVAYSPESRRAMARAPLERILIETDSPVRYKEGEIYFQAEPKDVTRTWKALAQLKNLDDQEVLAAVNINAKGFFRI